MPERQVEARELISRIEQTESNSFRVAITGVPGAGKSTFIDQLGMNWINKGHRVAVLAIDPSSSLSHGSILGDKTRMTELSRHKDAFVRPSPTRLHLGGIASSSYETTRLCEFAGFDRMLVETVGVGQSETLASQLCDCCLLLVVTGTGDDLQGVKKGILETADLVVVNKADGSNVELAQSFARELKSLTSLWPDRLTGEKAKITTASALLPDSIDAVASQLELFYYLGIKKEFLFSNRLKQKEFWLVQMLHRRLEQLFYQNPDLKAALELAKDKVKKPGTSIVQVVESLLDKLK